MAKAKKQESAAAQLRAKQAELKKVEAEIVQANADMDADALVGLRGKAEALRTFISSLEVTTRAEAEADAKERAREWLANRQTDTAAALAAIEKAQAVASERIKEAVAAIEQEAAARRALVAEAESVEVLAARFGLIADSARINLPLIEDHATPILRVVDAMRPSRSTRRRLSVPMPAGATPERRRQETLRVVGEWVDRFGAGLPIEVRGILEAAPIAVEVITKPGMSEREQQDARAMGKLARDTGFAMKFRGASVA